MQSCVYFYRDQAREYSKRKRLFDQSTEVDEI
jgi:hypothetical protein